jgi:transcription initiation factor TFIIIB Brf1 subunit/transcription initiation factor TFIIB
MAIKTLLLYLRKKEMIKTLGFTIVKKVNKLKEVRRWEVRGKYEYKSKQEYNQFKDELKQLYSKLSEQDEDVVLDIMPLAEIQEDEI